MRSKNKTERIELDAAEKRCRALADEISDWLQQEDSTASTGSKSKKSHGCGCELASAPLDVGPSAAKAAVRRGPDVRLDLGDALRRLAAEVRLHQVAARAGLWPRRWRWAARLTMPAR